MIKNLSLRSKLLLILFLLFLPLIYFAVNTLVIEKQKADSLEETYFQLNEINKVSDLLYSLQREKALSQGYLITSGKTFIGRLKKQRTLTDKHISELTGGNIKNSLQDLTLDLTTKRAEIDVLQVDSLQFESFFQNFFSILTDELENHISFIDDSEIIRQTDAYSQFLKSQLYLAEMRTSAIKGIASLNLNSSELIKISGRKSLFNFSIDYFLKNTTQDVREFYFTKANTEVVEIVNAFVEAALLEKNKDLSSESSLIWFDRFSEYIEVLKQVDNYAIAKIKDDIVIKLKDAKQRLLVYIIFVMSMLIIATWLSIYIINNLLKAVLLLKQAADRVAEGDVSVSVPFISNDEIGSLAKSFKSVVIKNNELATISNEIGKGNYDITIPILSNKDILSNALERMKISLKTLSEADKKRNWILTGASDLNDLITHERNLSSVSKKIINHICEYITSELGIIYLLNDHGKLEAMAGYAFNVDEGNKKFLDPSDNLMGKALENNKIIKLEGVKFPEFTIKTGLLNSEPAEVLIVPLNMQDHSIGIIELASRNKFSSDKIEFLEHIDEKIASIIITLKAELKNAELLAETQRQAKELVNHQEELKHNNMELLAQKNKLQFSEEELKANQEELEEKNVELEDKAKLLEEQYVAISSKNSELEEAKLAIQEQINELQRIGKYKSDFLANMSHELRTPLNSILILAKLISENREQNLTSKQVEFAEVIHNSGNDLLKLINEILDLTKIESGKISLELNQFSLQELKVEGLFKELARNKNIDFEVKFADDLPQTMYSDRFRIEQILKNLLSNAFKFTETGGTVKLDVHVPESRIYKNNHLNTASKVIAFSIYDSGIGISEKEQKIIFDAFQQADTSTTRKFGGTGLGLSISRELSLLLGGEISVTSEKGKGSCFTLYLPEKLDKEHVLIEGDSPPQKSKEKELKTSFLVATEKLLDKSNPKTILIIEDDKGFSKILADFAKSKKIEPVTTNLGKKGFELAKQVKPSAILLDLQLPDISGWEVLEMIKNDNEIKHIPVHIMSAYDMNPSQKGIAKENCLPKPVSLESLDKAFYKINSMNNQDVKKVLIVEDNEIEANAVKELLLAHELHSEVALSGEDALRTLKNDLFDCIILDINMPGTGGYEVLEKLKKIKRLKDIPVIIYSGKDFNEEEEFKLKKYVNAIVIKTDYSYERLLDEVKLFLHKVQEKFPITETPKIYTSDESLKNKKVLIVDDDSRNTYSLYNAFEAEAMKIVVANNGLEALERLDQNPDIHIILMDIMMPEMDGLECTRRIKKNPKTAGIPIIALTAKAMKEDNEKCIAAGASDYVTKPVNVERLLSLMRVWIHRNENIIMY